MCVYNQDKYLHESIGSILNQTYSNLEFVIVEDGSTDNSLNLLKNYDYQDKRIRLIINDNNIGHAKSLNIGLNHCMGKYIARMDSDDIAMKERIHKQVVFMESTPEVGLCGTAIEFFDKKSGIKVYPEEDIEIRMNFLVGNPFAHPTAMIRSNIIKKHGIKYKENYIASEDFLMWVKISEVSKVHNLDEPLLKYRVHDSQLTSKLIDVQTNEKKETCDYLYNRIGFKNPQFNYHEFIRILNNDYTPNMQTLIANSKLLSYAIEVNNSSNYLPNKRFNELIFGKWKHMTHGSTRLGLSFFKVFYNSPLSKWEDLDYLFKIKFFVKCLLKY